MNTSAPIEIEGSGEVCWGRGEFTSPRGGVKPPLRPLYAGVCRCRAGRVSGAGGTPSARRSPTRRSICFRPSRRLLCFRLSLKLTSEKKSCIGLSTRPSYAPYWNAVACYRSNLRQRAGESWTGSELPAAKAAASCRTPYAVRSGFHRSFKLSSPKPKLSEIDLHTLSTGAPSKIIVARDLKKITRFEQGGASYGEICQPERTLCR